MTRHNLQKLQSTICNARERYVSSSDRWFLGAVGVDLAGGLWRCRWASRAGAQPIAGRPSIASGHGDGSLRTAEASECAADQGKFWPMREMLYARQDSVYSGTDLDATLAGFAKDLGLDTTAFSSCMQTHKHQQFVQDDYRAAVAAGVQFRPAFDINGAKLTGALPFTTFQKQIDAALPK